MQDKALVAMSGGVDSSVALLKTIEMGYQPIGVTMKLWDYSTVGGNVTVNDNNCCALESINDAKIVCDQLGVPHYTLDFTDVFRKKVVDDFASEYLKARTPNPCVRCNSYVKWDAFIDQANKLNAKYIVTGHYAQIDRAGQDFIIKKGVDPIKDQSYVLWGIPKETISRTILPLGGLTKKEVRQIASNNNLETANTPESMEICFVADNNYKRFLKDYSSKEMSKIGKGKIVNESNKTIGEHDGYPNYTVGQRKGVGLAHSKPRYVKSIDKDSNTVMISEKKNMFSSSCNVSKENWLVDTTNLPSQIEAQIRYNSKPVKCTISDIDKLSVDFKEPQFAVTPGQSIVFYKEDVLLGGGIIETK